MSFTGGWALAALIGMLLLMAVVNIAMFYSTYKAIREIIKATKTTTGFKPWCRLLFQALFIICMTVKVVYADIKLCGYSFHDLLEMIK